MILVMNGKVRNIGMFENYSGDSFFKLKLIVWNVIVELCFFILLELIGFWNFRSLGVLIKG